MFGAGTARAHGPEMLLGSTEPGAGQLALDFAFDETIVLSRNLSVGGLTLYANLNPGFEWLQNDEPGGLFALRIGTPFRLHIVAIDYDLRARQGLSAMFDGTTLTEAGQAAFVATTTATTDDHYHPQWQLLLPDGETGVFSVSFRLTSVSPAYTDSPTYTLRFTNGTVFAATPTTTAATTSTPTPSPRATATATSTQVEQPIDGDANCDTTVTAADVIATIVILGAAPDCGADANRNGVVDGDDLAALHASLFPF